MGVSLLSKGFKFQTKLFLNYSLIVVVIVTLSLTFFYLYISKISLRQSEDNLDQLASSTMSNIDSLLSDMNMTSLYVISNPVIKDVFSSIKKKETDSNYFETVPEEKKLILSTLVAINLNNSQSNFRTSLYN